MTGRDDKTARLRIIATSDLHMHVLPFDYIADRAVSGFSLAGLQPLIARLRAEEPASLLFDGGDFLQGTPMADHYGLVGEPAAEAPHPMIAAMNALRYDGAAIGNHEFDYGLDFLESAVAKAAFPVLSTNLKHTGAEARAASAIAATAMIERQLRMPSGETRRLRIGLIGLTPPQVNSWGHVHIGGRLVMHDMVEAARTSVPALRARGADLVVALAHTGIGDATLSPDMENAALPLAQLPGIDALVLGHSHLVFPAQRYATTPGADIDAGMLWGRPAVMPGRWGSHLGVIDLDLAPGAEGGWHVAGSRARAIPAPIGPAAQAPSPPAHHPLCRVTGPVHAETRAQLARPIGRSTHALHSYFATIADGPAQRIVAAAQRAWARRRVAGTPFAGLPLLSAVPPFRAGGRGGPQNFTDVPAGQLLMRHAHDLYMFPNMASILCISGADLRGWLERVASLYARIPPEACDAPVILPEAASYYFDLIDGTDYAFDLSAPARFGAAGALRCAKATRLRRLSINGRAVAPEEQLLLVTNNFRAGGGGGFPGARPENVVIESCTPIRNLLVSYLAEAGSDAGAGDAEGHWQIHAPSGTSLLYRTGPGALRHLGDIAHLRPEPLGLDSSGFLRLRLHF